MIDALVGGTTSSIFIFLIMGYDLRSMGKLGTNDQVFFSLMGMLMFLFVHGYLLATRGQTIGKLVVGIRIVRLDGSLPAFVPLIFTRYVPVWLATQLPVAGSFCGLVNVLFIFREDRRCIHDLLAGTKVVKVT